jgi:GNAT superfamily N-acetyltransferase
MNIRIAYLADHPEALPGLVTLFETEWEEYYGPDGPGDAEHDLLAYSGRDRLPIGVVAFCDGRLCGIAALKPDSISTHTHLGPWAAAGLVLPELRRRGIGAHLLQALEEVARDLGHTALYTGTSTASSLLERNGWELVERLDYHGEDLSIYRKAIG